jgi:hypothetical protein
MQVIRTGDSGKKLKPPKTSGYRRNKAIKVTAY